MISNSVMVVYVIGMAVVGIIIASALFATWKKFFVRAEAEDEHVRPTHSEWTTKVVVSFMLVAVFLLVCIVGYTHINDLYAYPKAEQNPAEVQHIEDMQSHVSASDEELEAKSDAQETKRYGERHEKALSSFEEAMQQEAQKIKDRNDPE